MKEIYMHESEMPKNCNNCKFETMYSEENQEYFCIHNNCPLRSLEAHDKEVEKRVARNIADWIDYRACNGGYSLSFQTAIKTITAQLRLNYSEVDE